MPKIKSNFLVLRNVGVGIALGAPFLYTFLFVQIAQAELIHRFTFKDGSADDSIGKVNGKLEGGAKIIDGKLELKNLTKTSGDETLQYLSFGETLLPKAGSATIEVWFTSKCDGQYARVFDFGARGQGYLFLTVDEGNDTARAAITSQDWGEESTLRSDQSVNDGKLHMIAVVIDAKASTLQLFVDGRQNDTPQPMGDSSLEKIKGKNYWLGRSQYETDAGFSGSINELHVFDTALTADEIKSHFKAGPTVIESPKK